VVIDAVRCARLALERGIGGALYAPSSYCMKSPPEQYTDDVARAKLETFIAGSDHHGQPEFEPVLSQPTGI
jgi:myo-inositol-1-phosphate synthase